MSTQSDLQAYAASVQQLTETLRQAINDPAQQIQHLLGLAAFGSATANRTPTVVEAVTARLMRRAALTSLARAVSLYQPTTVQDAEAVRDAVAAAFEAEAVRAADAGETLAFSQLRATRAAVCSHLDRTAINLPNMTTVRFARSLPAMVVAQQLYGDARRYDEVVARANPQHPSWMPRAFTALNR